MENKKDSEVKKEFGLTSLSVTNRTTIFVLTVIIAIVGLVTYNKLPKENFPEVVFPTIYVGTPYPGNSPVDIEALITRPIEKEINTISEVEKITSNSVQDYSTVVVEFSTEMDASEALRKVKDAVDKARPELPTDLDQEPDVFDIDVSEFPIMNINLSGNFSNERLKEYAEYLEDEIERFPEISKVEIRGLEEKEVEIQVDLHKMEARQVTFGDISGAISNENMTVSGGNLESNGSRRTIRVLGEFQTPTEMEDIVVKSEKGNIVYLNDVAAVDFGYKERESYARASGKPVVMLDVIKASGENLINASTKIKALVEEAQANELPQQLEVTITNDQSDQTVDQVSSLENNIISGVILVVLVLLFFLGSRNSLFVGIAIPMSMLMSFMILGLLGISINMMVLFGLIMALGMLVDNGIVVVENVYRLKEKGLSNIEAAKQGVGEVALPIISSTATTLAAFLPLAFWPGIMGEFMGYLPITLIIALGSSLFVALVINPVFIAQFMSVHEKDKKPNARFVRLMLLVFIAGLVVDIFAVLDILPGGIIPIANFAVLFGGLSLLNVFIFSPASSRFQNNVLPKLDNFYEKFLKKALGWKVKTPSAGEYDFVLDKNNGKKIHNSKNPLLTFFGTIAMLFVSIGIFVAFTPGVIFFPSGEPHYVNIFVEYPIGTDVETTNKTTKEIEHKIMQSVEPYKGIVESVISHVGEGTADPGDLSAVGESNTPNKSRITVSFLKYKLRNGISTKEVMEKIRNDLDTYPGLTITIAQDKMGPPVGKPVNIEISGESLETLKALSDDLQRNVENSSIAGIEELKTNLEVGKPELTVQVNREKARRFGISTGQVADNIRTALFGKEVSKYKEGEDDYPIQIRLDEQYRHNIDALMNQRITFRDMATGQIKSIPTSSIADVKYSSTYGSVKRKDLDRVVTLSSNVLEGYNATDINNQIKDLISAEMDIPSGYEIKFTGEQEKQAEEMSFLSQALMMAVFLIFLIIVAQFNKISAPFIIMTSVVLSTIGVFLGLVIFQMDFIVVMTMIGIISLAGIVVNNAIVLIDFIELNKKARKKILNIEKGFLPKDQMIGSIIEAGKTRLRPVLLTAITTILGLIPLAVGLNIDFIGLFMRLEPDIYLGGDTVIFWGPMSWTIIFGLTFATFLTLVAVPVMYYLSETLKRRFVKVST